MNTHPLSGNDRINSHPDPTASEGDPGLRKFADRLLQNVNRDAIIQRTTDELRDILQVDRVVLYYFYSHWHGQVVFESLSSQEYSIFGETGPDECFNNEYARLYLAGRVKAIADIETEIINPCHRDFLRSMRVRANLVIPVVNHERLWGLLIAHQCQAPRQWLASEVEVMKEAAANLAISPIIQQS